MLRHWIPFENLDVRNLLLSNPHMGVINMLEHEFNSRKSSKKKAFCKKLSSTIRSFTDGEWIQMSQKSNLIW